MGGINTVGAVNAELVRSKLLDKLADLSCPLHWHVFVIEIVTAEFVACFISDDCWILSICETSVRIYMRQEMLDVGLEVVDDGGVVIELHRFWWVGR